MKLIKDVVYEENFDTPEKAFFTFYKYEAFLGLLDYSEAV
jgi:hypothetical protein